MHDVGRRMEEEDKEEMDKGFYAVEAGPESGGDFVAEESIKRFCLPPAASLMVSPRFSQPPIFPL